MVSAHKPVVGQRVCQRVCESLLVWCRGISPVRLKSQDNADKASAGKASGPGTEHTSTTSTATLHVPPADLTQTRHNAHQYHQFIYPLHLTSNPPSNARLLPQPFPRPFPETSSCPSLSFLSSKQTHPGSCRISSSPNVSETKRLAAKRATASSTSWPSPSFSKT